MEKLEKITQQVPGTMSLFSRIAVNGINGGRIIRATSSKVFMLLVALVLLTSVARAQTPIVITGTKFTYPLLSKWIAEYSKENPQVQFLLVSKDDTSKKRIDISVIAHLPENNELNETKQSIYVNKFALLPVGSSTNSYVKSLKGRTLDRKDIVKLYFEESIFETNKNKKPSPVNVYSRSNKVCSSVAFANFFGRDASEIRGKKVVGDDICLLSSVKKDSIGITFNNLGYLYDKNTRRLKDGIAVLPLDVDKSIAASFDNVDDAISILEKEKIETIPVEKVSFLVDKSIENKELVKFLNWVINNGQQFNHEFGFLNLDKEIQVEQSQELTELLSLK